MRTPVDRTLLLVVSATGLAMLVAFYAAWHRVPWSDEGSFASAAYNLTKHGFFGTTLIDPEASGLLRIDQRTYWVLPGYLLYQAAWQLFVPGAE